MKKSAKLRRLFCLIKSCIPSIQFVGMQLFLFSEPGFTGSKDFQDGLRNCTNCPPPAEVVPKEPEVELEISD